MSATKEAELTLAVLLYAVRCLAEGDQLALRGMNFGPKEVEALRAMSLGDLYRIESLQAHCLDIRLNRAVYWPLMEHLQREREGEQLQQDLIQADAPFEMMQRLFGMGSREYTRLRKLLSLPSSVGRPPLVDDGLEHRVWDAWSQLVREGAPDPLSPQQYLALHQDTGAPMRALWTLTRRWAEYGDLFSGTGSGDATSQTPQINGTEP